MYVKQQRRVSSKDTTKQSFGAERVGEDVRTFGAGGGCPSPGLLSSPEPVPALPPPHYKSPKPAKRVPLHGVPKHTVSRTQVFFSDVFEQFLHINRANMKDSLFYRVARRCLGNTCQSLINAEVVRRSSDCGNRRIP